MSEPTFTAEQTEAQRAFVAACKPGPIPAVERVGIELGVAARDYHRRERYVASKSALDQVHKSPAHYLAWLNGEESDPTPAQRFGSAFHTLVLEPERYEGEYIIKPEGLSLSSKDGRAWKEEHGIASADDPRLLTSEQQRDLLGMQASVHAHPAASRIIQDGQSEVTLRWVDAETGVRCKSRADYWVKGRRLCADLKTTEDASPEAFMRSVADWRYHVQDAFYRAGFDACGEGIEHFALIAVEKKPPYAVAVYTLDSLTVHKGYTAARVGVERMAECIREGKWPAYYEGVAELSLPPWAA